MKTVCGILLLQLLSHFAFGQDGGAPFSSRESHIAAAEVFQVTLPDIKVYTEDGVKRVTINIETTIGDIESQWVRGRLNELRRHGAKVEFVITGTDIHSSSFRETIDIVNELKTQSDNVLIGTENINIPRGIGELEFQKARRTFTIASVMMSGVYTGVAATFGTDIPVGYTALMGLQAALVTGVTTYNSTALANWVSKSGLRPGPDAKDASTFQAFIKSWTIGTGILYLLKQTTAMFPVYQGVTNPAAILMDASIVGLAGLFSKFYLRQSINYKVNRAVEADPTSKYKMDIWRMRTGFVMALAIGAIEQAANFHVPFAGMALMGIGVAGYIVYKYVTGFKVADVMHAIIKVKEKFTLRAVGIAATCSLLFMYPN
jgi:hypothetical protein